MDWRVLGATFAVALVAGIVCGIFPALASTRRDPREALSTSGRTVAGSHDRLRRVFVVAQLALAIVLATGAGLLLKSFSRMGAVDPGFRASGVVTFSASLPAAAFPNAADVRTFDASVVDRLRQIPGVESATNVNWMPLGRAGLVHVASRSKASVPCQRDTTSTSSSLRRGISARWAFASSPAVSSTAATITRRVP